MPKLGGSTLLCTWPCSFQLSKDYEGIVQGPFDLGCSFMYSQETAGKKIEEKRMDLDEPSKT